MRTICFLSVCCSLFFLYSCDSSPRKDGTVQILNVNGHKVIQCDLANVKGEETILLSDLIKDCELIRFDDTDEALFNAWMVTATDNYIGIRQSGKPYKLFDKKGKYLCDIGKVGNGPGEYNISIYDEIIDEKNKRIYFAPFVGDKIMVYDLQGKYIKDITLPYRVQKPKIELLDPAKGILTIAHMPFTNDKAFALQIDFDGNVIKEVAPTDNMRVSSFDGELFSFRNAKGMDLNHTGLDTLYNFNIKDLTLAPVFTTTPYSTEEGWIRMYREFPTFYFTNTFNWKTGEGFAVSTRKDKEVSSKVKVVNDFWGNMEVSLFAFNKGYLVFNVEPGKLMETIEKRLKEQDCTQKDKEKLNSLLSTLDEDSNNLLFLGKLKM